MIEHPPLESCPFCGEPAVLTEYNSGLKDINCPNECLSKSFQLETDAIKHWNTRTTDKLKSENRRLRYTLERIIETMEEHEYIGVNTEDDWIIDTCKQALNSTQKG